VAPTKDASLLSLSLVYAATSFLVLNSTISRSRSSRFTVTKMTSIFVVFSCSWPLLAPQITRLSLPARDVKFAWWDCDHLRLISSISRVMFVWISCPELPSKITPGTCCVIFFLGKTKTYLPNRILKSLLKKRHRRMGKEEKNIWSKGDGLTEYAEAVVEGYNLKETGLLSSLSRPKEARMLAPSKTANAKKKPITPHKKKPNNPQGASDDDDEWLPEEIQCNQKTCQADANYTCRKNKCGLKIMNWLNRDCHKATATVKNDADGADDASDPDSGVDVDETNENEFCTKPKVALKWMRKKGIKSKTASLNILTACMSKTYNISIADASRRWLQEIEVMKRINTKVNNLAKSAKIKERHVKGAFFALCVLHYLVFGIHFDNHENPGEMNASCPYVDDAINFIITLVKTNKCVCKCYTEYVLAACEEFGYDDCVVPQRFPGHVNVAVIFRKGHRQLKIMIN
jgi:hypothetical protein